MVFGFPVFDQSDQHGKVSNFEGPFDCSLSCAEMVAANWMEKTVANAEISPVPAQPTAAFVFHFAGKANISYQIIVDDVEHCQNTSDYRKHSQVHGPAI